MSFDTEKAMQIYDEVRQRLYDANISRPEGGSNEEALGKIKAFLDGAATIAVGKWGASNEEMPMLADALARVLDAYLELCQTRAKAAIDESIETN